MFLFEVAKKWASGKLNKTFSKVSVSLVLKKKVSASSWDDPVQWSRCWNTDIATGHLGVWDSDVSVPNLMELAFSGLETSFVQEVEQQNKNKDFL